MNWVDTGILLSKNKFQENSTIVNFYTKNHGKCSGIIFGASSKKIKNYLQIGNELHLNYNSKSDDSFGYFKVEILKVNTPIFFSKKRSMYCINSALNLVKLLTVDNQKNELIYKLVHNLFTILEKEDWYIDYIYWELDFLRPLSSVTSLLLSIDFNKLPSAAENNLGFTVNSYWPIAVSNPMLLLEFATTNALPKTDFVSLRSFGSVDLLLLHW